MSEGTDHPAGRKHFALFQGIRQRWRGQKLKLFLGKLLEMPMKGNTIGGEWII